MAIVLVEQVGAHGDTQQQSCNFQTYVFRIIAVLSTKTDMIITWPAISIPETYMSLGVSTKCISGYLGPGIIIDQTILYLWHHQQEQKKETVWNSNWAIHSQGGCCCLPALNSFRISKTNSSLVFFLAGSFSCWCTSVLQTIATSVCSYHHHHHHPNSSLFIENQQPATVVLEESPAWRKCPTSVPTPTIFSSHSHVF